MNKEDDSDILGITSTYVENTADARKNFHPFEDHLHIRGEYVKLVTFFLVGGGSPPHTWRIPFLSTCT